MIFDGMTFRRSTTIEAYHDPSSPYVRFRYKHRRREVVLKAHSLTNMAYGVDGRVYLLKNGQVWTTQTRRAH